MRFTHVMSAISASPTSHRGNGSQCSMIPAPAIASTGITTTQKYQ